MILSRYYYLVLENLYTIEKYLFQLFIFIADAKIDKGARIILRIFLDFCDWLKIFSWSILHKSWI